MKPLFLIYFLFMFVSCGIQQQNQNNTLEDENKELLLNMSDYQENFLMEASNFAISEIEFPQVYLSESTEHVSCDSNNNILINKNKWTNLNKALVKPDRVSDYPLFIQAKKAMIFKGYAICGLNQNTRNKFNKYTKIVPVPSSLTYKYGVASSWLVNYCYNSNNIGIYASLDECDRYYMKSFWSAYMHELFASDDTYVLESAHEFENSI